MTWVIASTYVLWRSERLYTPLCARMLMSEQAWHTDTLSQKQTCFEPQSPGLVLTKPMTLQVLRELDWLSESCNSINETWSVQCSETSRLFWWQVFPWEARRSLDISCARCKVSYTHRIHTHWESFSCVFYSFALFCIFSLVWLLRSV